MKLRSGFLAAAALSMLLPLAVVAAEGETPANTENAKPAKRAAAPAKCSALTGSRIQRSKKATCEEASNRTIRSYSADEIQATGKLDLTDAMGKLDPAAQ